MATLAMPTLLSSIEEQSVSSPLVTSEGVDPDFDADLRAKIQEGLRHLVEGAKADRDVQLQSRDLSDAECENIIRRFDDEMKSVRRLAEEQYQQIMARVKAEREWTEGTPAPELLVQEQQAILDAIMRQHAVRPRRPPSPRPRSSSDASSVADNQRGEQSARSSRADDGERPPERSRSSYGRQPATPSGSIRGGVPQPVSGISAYFNGPMYGGPSDADVAEPGRGSVSRRPSQASMPKVSRQEIWIPPNTPDEARPASHTLAHASSDSPVVPQSTRRESFASSGGRLSRSGSIQSNVVQTDPDLPPSTHVPRERDVPEDHWQPSARAREKQREAQPQLVRPRVSADITSRRNDDRAPAVPSPAWSQFSADGQYPFSAHAGSSMDYSPSPTERRGIPIVQGSSRSSSMHQGSPESLRPHPARAATKSSWSYDYSPLAAGPYASQSLQSNLATGPRALATKRSFTVDDDLRPAQGSPIMRTYGRRDSTGSRSVRSQRSKPDMYGRHLGDGSNLSPLPSDDSGMDGFAIDWDDSEYGVEAFERREEDLKLDRRAEELQKRDVEVRQREEDVRRKEDDVRNMEEDAKKKDADARRREDKVREREHQVRKWEEEARQLEDEARKLDAAAIKREEDVRQREDEARRRDREAKRREDESRRVEDAARRKEEDAKQREDEVKRMDEEVRQRAQVVGVLEEELRVRRGELDLREEELRHKESDIRRREEELQRSESDIQHREEELKAKELGIRSLEEDMHRQLDDAQRLEAESLAERTREDEENRRRAEASRQAERARVESRARAEAQETERVRVERARREAQEAQETRRLAEARRAKEEETRRREEARRLEAQRLEEARQREAVQRQEVEAEARRRAEVAQRESAERPNGDRDEAPRPDSDLNVNDPDLIREQEVLWRKYGRNRNDSLSSDGSPRSTTFASASQSSAPRNIPGRTGSTATSASADRSSTASSSSYGSTSGFSSFSGHSSTSTYTQASSATPTSTPTPSVKQTRGGWKPAGAPPTSATTGQQPSASSSSLPPPTPQEEEEWKRRQREHARQQAEKFQRMQEAAEQERYARSAKPLSREEVVKVFEEHERRWSRLATLDLLTWYSFPWPILQRANSPEELTVQAIHAYVLSPHHPNEKNKSAKDLIKDYIKRWHPDRFETKFLPKVREDDREKVKEGAGVVARNLNEMLTRQSSALHDFAT
ncbi:hypothetical protein EVJ58_g10149 [Rhodofomes roseus]|uniref:Uncharacterized protein n=1 Tax=Rhodofomes roseus TaxID=34475 RepID=A0A4Y9XS30_9APHY|nr:hypothetical protein EVJ58_g10149 [Rhodofomes roseus]